MSFAKRTNWFLGANPLSALLEEKRKRGDKVFDLTESNPTECGFSYLEPSLLSTFSNKKNLVYHPDSHGLLEAREAVCRYYADKKIAVDPGQIFLTASTSEAYSFLFRLLLDPGDGVLAPRPSYPLLDYLAGLNDAQLDFYRLEYQNAWAIDLEDLKPAFEKNPKAIVVVNPNNPTGNFVTEEETARIVQLCRDGEVALISDEVFLDYAWKAKDLPGPAARVPHKSDAPGTSDLWAIPLLASPAKSFASSNHVLTFTLSGISKILGLPQMKLSWIVVSGPEKLRKTAIEKLEVIADTYLSVNTPSQWALPIWLSCRETIIAEIRQRVIANRHLLGDTLNSQRIPTSQGGWYVLLPLKIGLSDDVAAMRLLERENVLTHPGYFYNFEEGHFLVVSLLPKTNLFKEAVERIAHCDILNTNSEN